MSRVTVAHGEERPEGAATATSRVRGEESAVSDYSVVTAAGVASAGFSFASATLTTRLLAPSAYGALSIVFVTSLILQTSTSAWTALAVARYGREALETEGDMRTVTRARIRLVAPWFVAATALVFGLKALGALPHQLTWPLVAVAVIHGTVATGYEHCINLLRSWGRQRLSAVTVLVQQLVLVVIVAVLLAGRDHVSPLQIALLYAAGSVALLMLYVPLLWNVALRPKARDRTLERRMLRFSTPLILFTVSSYVIGSIDLWILGAYAPSAAVGRYAAVYRAYTTLMGVAAIASPVLTTLFVSMRVAGRGAELRGFVERVTPTVVVVVGGLTATLIVPAYVLVPIAFGHPFAAAALPFAILLVGLVAYLECCLLGTVLTAQDRTADTARAITLAAMLNVVGDLVAIGGFGAGTWAPAVATTGASILMALGYSRAAARCTGSRQRSGMIAYMAPTATVVALAVAPAHGRILTALVVGLLAGALTIGAAARSGFIDLTLVRRRVLGATEVGAYAPRRG